ncbi:trace amine-associated receptor 7d-like [Patiria miniata]|uniref:G-protein coupled receptors family 1 profile domain-containing protein n=1 Tax=Patiria miniata TaxID=46514 RepID=A0A913ZXB6_PATMI|nr:trace amine-associated receptor 7d-like [Patiria miniata]
MSMKNATSLISLEEAQTDVWVCQIIAAEGVFGFLGNLLVCFVILRVRFLHTMTNYLLVNLAVADMLLCLCTFFHYLFASSRCTLINMVPSSSLGRELYCRLVASQSLIWVFFNASAYNLCVVTLERYIAIVHPLKYARKVTATRMKTLVTLLWMLSVLLALPFLFTIKASDDLDKACSDIEYLNQAFPILLSVVLVSFTYIMPVIMMSWAYYKMQVTLKRQAQALNLQRARAAAVDLVIARQRVISMLTIVLGALIILWTPDNVCVILCLYPTSDSTLNFCGSESFKYISGITSFLLYLNSVVNPIIYELKYKKFRKGLRAVFCTCLDEHGGSNSVDAEMARR